ncbi:RICIN domain-containing protein [Streptomyces sp. NPDC002536]
MVKFLRSALVACTGAATAVVCTTAAHAVPGTADPTPAETIVNLRMPASDMCLDIAGDATTNTQNGAKAIQWACDGSDSQKWRVIPVDNSSFELRSVRSGKCLEVENSGTQNGADVQIWECTGGKQMRWQTPLVDPVKKLYEFRVTHTTDRCLNINGGADPRKNGIRAISWQCDQSIDQLWQIKVVK